MNDIKSELKLLEERIKKAKSALNTENIKQLISALEKETLKPEFWNDQKEAQKISKKLSDLTETINIWDDLEKSCSELMDLCDIIDEEKEPEERKNVKTAMQELEKNLKKAEIMVFLNEKYDQNNAILSVHVGTGGADAHDWAKMLLRMYLRYFEEKTYKAEIIEKSESGDGGIKSAAIKVEGGYAYGYLKEEAGVHRLVRLSPFNVGNTRETSFALVEVVPEMEEDDGIQIKEDDLKIDVFAASGPGGQNVNTSNSAVRITHLPTNLVATCQNERSQLQNKEQTMKILKGKLMKLKEKQKAETIEEIKGEQKEATWGSQIRSYVLHPYQMVKDHRTDFETNQTEKMLNGELLDEFIEASLEKKARK